MIVCHFSDLHAQFDRLPKADLYVCTGDMYPNWLKVVRGHISYDFERRHQARFAEEVVQKGGFQALLGSPNSPVVCVRGNHDFIDLAPLFGGCNVTELKDNEVVEVLGLRVTGHRGVPTIDGRWQDETARPDLLDRFKAMDLTCDLYLTHYPPAGVGLDLPGNWGLAGAANWMYYNTGQPTLWCSGHIHESGGKVAKGGQATFSNAAATYTLLENTETGWEKVG